MKYLILLFTISCLVACSKNDGHIDSFLDCEPIAENCKTYEGEKIKCQFHYVLTKYNDQQFIELRAPCADLTRPYVFNENCEDICETLPHNPNSECGKYLQKREVLETLFIQKE